MFSDSKKTWEGTAASVLSAWLLMSVVVGARSSAGAGVGGWAGPRSWAGAGVGGGAEGTGAGGSGMGPDVWDQVGVRLKVAVGLALGCGALLEAATLQLDNLVVPVWQTTWLLLATLA